MITITLKLGEGVRLRLGPEVEVTLLAARDGEVRLGIDGSPGPQDVAACPETWQAIQLACQEKQESDRAKAAAQSPAAPVEAPPPTPDAPGQAGRPPSGA